MLIHAIIYRIICIKFQFEITNLTSKGLSRVLQRLAFDAGYPILSFQCIEDRIPKPRNLITEIFHTS